MKLFARGRTWRIDESYVGAITRDYYRSARSPPPTPVNEAFIRSRYLTLVAIVLRLTYRSFRSRPARRSQISRDLGSRLTGGATRGKRSHVQFDTRSYVRRGWAFVWGDAYRRAFFFPYFFRPHHRAASAPPGTTWIRRVSPGDVRKNY